MSWTPELNRQFKTIREQLVANFNNNMNVVKARSVPAALDYPNASNEVSNSKSTIQNVTQRMAQESETLAAYLKSINEQQGTDLATDISETEQKLRKLEKENRLYEQDADVKKEQVEAVYNKYEGNYHSQNYMYAPWEIDSSKWFSYSPISSYLNLNPAARSGLLFLAFFLGFAAILILGTRVVLAYYASTGSRGYSSSTSTVFNSAKPGLARRWGGYASLKG
jgi:hypothetical protein